jgi:hypothetical protein
VTRAYLDDVARELGAVGIGGALRRRIVAELGDHLDCDPAAELGPPALIARQFADTVGTGRARRATIVSFTALAFAGIVFAVAAGGAFFGHHHSTQAEEIRVPASALATIAAQVSFVSGVLAAMRALWHRGDAAFTRADATVILRRAAVALIACLVAIAALGVVALGFKNTSWQSVALIGVALSAAGLLAASPSVIAAARVRPTGEGAAADMFADFGPLVPPVLRGRPWLFAGLIATGLAVAIATQGLIASDPYDGLISGVGEATACLAGFALLGRYLALYSSDSA